MPQSHVVMIFLSGAAYDANLPSHHTAQNVVQLARGLETPSQCLLCERLFKLNWYFCNTALSERSGRRIAEALRQREAHCGQSAPQVRCHWGHSMAGVKGHCGSSHATVEIQSCWVKSIWAGQRSPFCVCVCKWVSFVLFVYVWACARVCMRPRWALCAVFVCRNSADAGLSHPWNQQFAPSGERVTERGVNHADAPIMPLLCPCGCINSAIAAAAANGKVLHKTLWDKSSVHLCAPWRREGTKSLTRAEKWTDWIHTVTWPLVCCPVCQQNSGNTVCRIEIRHIF